VLLVEVEVEVAARRSTANPAAVGRAIDANAPDVVELLVELVALRIVVLLAQDGADEGGVLNSACEAGGEISYACGRVNRSW
jgi:hypothetical protein